MTEREKIQQEAIEALEKANYNGIVVLPTGVGKSKIMVECIKKLRERLGDVKILYLCNSTTLRDTGFREELNKWECSEENIEFMCYQSACKMKNYSYDLLLADEFDYSLTKIYSRVYLNNEFHYKILLSATIEEDKLDLAKSVAPIVYRKELKQVEDRGVLNKSNYYFVNFKMSEEETKKYLELNKKYHGLLLYKQSIESELLNASEEKAKRLKGSLNKNTFDISMVQYERKRMLNSLESSANICRQLMSDIYKDDRECRIVVFSELTSQADRVCKYTYHGKSEEEDNLNKFKNQDIQALSVCGKINRGENIKGINNIIIESCNSSKTQLTQRLGRGKRLQQDEILNVYFLVPYYLDSMNRLKPTKVLDWIGIAGRSLDFSTAKTYKFK